MAHQAWLSLIDNNLLLRSLPLAAFDTQASTILRSGGQTANNEPVSGISVICSASPASNLSEVMSSERGQVLDGVVRYGDDRVIVLESKLTEGASDYQAVNINLNGQPAKFDRAVHISWRDVLAAFSDIADERLALVGGAERLAIKDFLDFVDRNFSYLGPFNTLRRCEGNGFRIRWRLDLILEEVIGSESPNFPKICKSVTRAPLLFDENSREINLAMWPADTLQQAREFYAREGSIDNVLALLKKENWHISPNFHFGFMASGLCWMTTTKSIEDYLEFWIARIREARAVPRHEWNQYWNMLVREKIVQEVEREDFDREFSNTKREIGTPRPGIACYRPWSLDEAEKLDATNEFVKQVRLTINQMLNALGESLRL